MNEAEQGSSSRRRAPSRRRDFLCFAEITTPWNDSDVYGHMNNAVHYALFDSVVNRWLHDVGDAHRAGSVVLVVEQNVQTALRSADRCYVIDRGRIAMEGSAKDLLADSLVPEGHLGV
jgi:hypothetical protein